ncbi:MAG: J domain-containing protein [Proteobacteria bacterium]|nr:J domain-containing protein [Pseudomonadota bacterium]MBU1639631.1 J domain-containing protein [Pseudomonadota bacterium]
MTAVVVEHELFQACQVIFGDELQISREFLEYVQMSGVKSAYRKLAKETHPDRLVSEGELAQVRGAQQFQVIQQAYKNLSIYLDAREKGFRFTLASSPSFRKRPSSSAHNGWATRSERADFTRKQAEARQSKKQDGSTAFQGQNYSGHRPTHKDTQGTLFTGRLPERQLLFGHFLYYSGLVSWQTIIKALVWQRSNRPRLGDIGRRFGWLTPEDIISLLKAADGKPFGARAVDKGLLTHRQVTTLLTFQKTQQHRIGEYFVQNRIFEKARLEEILNRYHAHNYRLSKRCRKAS